MASASSSSGPIGAAEHVRVRWTKILERRRLEEPDDTAEIKDQDLLKKMHADWFDDFYANEMTDEQKKKSAVHKLARLMHISGIISEAGVSLWLYGKLGYHGLHQQR